MRRMISHLTRVAIAGGFLAAALAGCASDSGFPAPGAPPAPGYGQFVSGAQPGPGNGKPTGPPPKVEDCAITNQGSPTKYVCNGKSYTSFDLSKLREDYKKQQESGK